MLCAGTEHGEHGRRGWMHLAVGDEVDATRVRLEGCRELLSAIDHCNFAIAATRVDTLAAAGAADCVLRKFPRPATARVEKRELTPRHGCTWHPMLLTAAEPPPLFAIESISCAPLELQSALRGGAQAAYTAQRQAAVIAFFPGMERGLRAPQGKLQIGHDYA